MKKQAVFLNKWGHQPTCWETASMFGILGGHHLPDEHRTAYWTDPNGNKVKLVLLTKAEAQLLGKSLRKCRPHRVMAECPECLKLIPAGRLHQHLPVHYTDETRPIHAAMERP